MRPFRREERLENLLLHVLRHSGAIVAEMHLQSFVVALAGNQQTPAAWHRINRVHDHVYKHFAQLRRTAIRVLFARRIELDLVLKSTNTRLVLPARSSDFDGVIEQARNINQLKLLYRRLPREGLNTTNRGCRVFSSSLNNVEITDECRIVDLT